MSKMSQKTKSEGKQPKNVQQAEPKYKTGQGGETHQRAEDGGYAKLTTQNGTPVADDQNTLKQGERGPSLIEDFHFREKLFHFDHERIPERVVHARGYGAHGFFENYAPIPELTQADLFQRKGEKTPVFVRFSTVAGNKGSFDLARDVRGFAVKFYTKQGNWDLVGNNIPVFFIQDALKFPDLVHAVKPAPDRGFPQAQSAHDNFWDFISLMPEAMHMIMWTMSDRAIPRSFRFMEGFGVHTFRLINAQGKSTFVKFIWKPKLGMQSVLWNEALKINGADPDFHRRDLWESIQSGDFPEWELCLQTFDEDFANSFDFDVLDATKLIPEELIPAKPVGRLVLDRMPDNFFAETEQVAFQTGNVVPGIGFTNDPLLQGRNFSYLDTQLKRLGSPNFTHIPVNAPKCPFAHFQQDGHMAMHNPKGRANYEPNSWPSDIAGPRETETGYKTFPEESDGPKLRVRAASFADHYSQARQFYVSQTDIEQLHIQNALIFELGKCSVPKIRERMVSHLVNIHTSLAAVVAHGLGLASVPAAATSAAPVKENLAPSDALSILKNQKPTLHGRKIGVLVSESFNHKILTALKALAKAEGAMLEVIGPKVAGVTADDGTIINPDHTPEGGPSVIFDSVVVLVAEAEVKKLLAMPPVRDFIADAYVHCKFIGYSKPAEKVFAAIGLPKSLDAGFITLDGKETIADFIQKCKLQRFWQREKV